MTYPENIGNILQKSLSQCGMLLKARRFQVFYMWEKVVGDIARNAKPRRLDGNVLYVTTASSAWAQELTLMSRNIISRINNCLGGNYIKEIRFSEHLWSSTKGCPDAYETLDKQYEEFLSEDVLTQNEKWQITSLAEFSEDPHLSLTFRRYAVTMKKRVKYLLTKGFEKCNTCGYLYKSKSQCPNCEIKKQFGDYNCITVVLEKYPETSDATLSVMTGVRQKQIFAKARQTLDSRWSQVIKRAYFKKSDKKLSAMEQDQLRQLIFKIVSLRTGKAEDQLTQEDIEKSLGKKYSALVRKRRSTK